MRLKSERGLSGFDIVVILLVLFLLLGISLLIAL